MNLLKVQALVGNKQPRKAVVCLQRALLADVDETYTPALRLELAKLYLAMNQLTQAKHQIALIRKESPWTREEIDARNLLDEIERKIGEVSP
jgi:predicted negative regulator of RcsB-dependent stress response